ncbi:MAG: hypothetical protein IKI97_14530 [Clostridia bacterium]|nr:hypothetical protein [Clostridia bacterium]
MLKQFEALLRAYTILEDLTPLKYDCGTLCDSLCCKNNSTEDETLGMWLLPYEKELLSALVSEDKQTDFRFGKAEDGTQTVFCRGRCKRQFRPFACRIYPFYADIMKDITGRTKIKVKIDPRARLTCPIAMQNSYLRPSIDFIAGVKSAVRELMKDQEIKKDLIAISEFLSEIGEMQSKLLGI